MGPCDLSGEFDWFQINAPLGREREARAGINVRVPF